jgi:HAD superfamily hydrolase (TIGR01490 family)
METISSEKVDKKRPAYTAFFDLDRTITKTVSGKVIAQAAHKKGLLKGSDLISALYNSFAFRLKLKGQRKIIDDMLGWVAGIKEIELVSLCSEVFRDKILPSIHVEAGPEVEFHKNNNARLVILSSSLQPLCNLVAEHLKMDDVICTSLDVHDGIYTGLASGIPCFGYEKVRRMKEYCEKNNSKPEEAWYYGDSKADLPVLESVGHPVCINPDRFLERTAKKKNWTIYNWS